MPTYECPRCEHPASDHSNLAGCTAEGDGGGTCPCTVKRRDLPGQRAADDAATAEALERVERGSDLEWVKAAESVLAAKAASGVPFTSDDLWYELAARGVESPREPRALGPIVQRALRAETIRQEGYATSRRRHRAVIRSYVGRAQ